MSKVRVLVGGDAVPRPGGRGVQASRTLLGWNAHRRAGRVRFTPSRGGSGSVAVEYTVADAEGRTSAPAQIIVSMSG